jgi:uncharacterized protein YfaS (alpha-2-macroglobulin family)
MARIRPIAVLVLAMLAIGGLTTSAGATTATRHQNPHYRVTASLLPTTVAVGDRLTAKVSVTNTTARAHMVAIEYEFDGPSSGEGVSMSPIRLAAHTTWSRTFRRTASEAGGYRLVIRARDALGASHAAATASAG